MLKDLESHTDYGSTDTALTTPWLLTWQNAGLKLHGTGSCRRSSHGRRQGPTAPHRLNVGSANTRAAAGDRPPGPDGRPAARSRPRARLGWRSLALKSQRSGQRGRPRQPDCLEAADPYPGDPPSRRRAQRPHPGEIRLHKRQEQGRGTPAPWSTHQSGGAVGPGADEPRLHGRGRASPSPRKPAAARTAPADRLNPSPRGAAFAYWVAAAARDGPAPPLIGNESAMARPLSSPPPASGRAEGRGPIAAIARARPAQGLHGPPALLQAPGPLPRRRCRWQASTRAHAPQPEGWPWDEGPGRELTPRASGRGTGGETRLPPGRRSGNGSFGAARAEKSFEKTPAGRCAQSLEQETPEGPGKGSYEGLSLPGAPYSSLSRLRLPGHTGLNL